MTTHVILVLSFAVELTEMTLDSIVHVASRCQTVFSVAFDDIVDDQCRGWVNVVGRLEEIAAGALLVHLSCGIGRGI